MAADIDQKRPMTTPMTARPAINVTALGARATIRRDAIVSSVSDDTLARRSMPRVADEIPRTAGTAKIPETAMA